MPQLSILFLLISFGSVGAVLFTPALPKIQNFFGLTIGQTQLTITSYLIGYAIGQLPYGPLANGIGRKKTLYIGITVAIIGSLLCALSASLHCFPLLIIGRFVQAVGACVGVKISFTMIADSYEQRLATQKISKLIMAFAVMPGVGVAIGGYITELFNWEACFYFLALFGLFNLLIAYLLPETAKSIDLRSIKLSKIYEGYRAKLKNKQLVLSGLIMGCGTGVVYLFASKAPFIGIQLIGLEPDVFGTLNLIPSAGMLAGSFLASRLAEHFPPLSLLQLAIIVSLTSTFTMIIPFLLQEPSIWSLFFPTALIYISATIIFAHITSFGLSTAKNKSNGSAMLSFLNLGTSFVIVLLSQFIFPASALVMPISFAIIFLIMLFLFFSLRRATTHLG